ncbi:MAG: 3-isopropylmalate dehydrogenase [Lachnospiraceae bacterium]|nr:3-isopropylmalate dehydrogenase [Lachnospiraceae bacterium]
MNFNIGVIAGDGIGPEITAQATRVLDKIGEVYNHKFNYTEILMGGASIDACGVPLTDEAVKCAKNSDAVLMGSIGGNTSTSPWYKLEPYLRPEAGLLRMRKELNLFANLRPAVLYGELRGACPLKEEISVKGFDMLIMRELTGGLYFGDRKTVTENGELKAYDELTYTEGEIRRIAIKGFEAAMKRKKKVTSVDKANVLDSSRLWRKVVNEVSADFPEVELEHMLVDNCAMQLVKDPAQFDVILTENMFGDILSDEASMVTGSIGMLASASLNETKFGLYEPSHGSAPDIAGMDIANPIATILSAAMMLRFSFDLGKEADAIETAVKQVLEDGYRTVDIMSEGKTKVGCTEMGTLLIERIK